MYGNLVHTRETRQLTQIWRTEVKALLLIPHLRQYLPRQVRPEVYSARYIGPIEASNCTLTLHLSGWLKISGQKSRNVIVRGQEYGKISFAFCITPRGPRKGFSQKNIQKISAVSSTFQALQRFKKTYFTKMRRKVGFCVHGHLYLDYGNTQLTNQIPSLEVTSYLFRGNYFAALRHFSYAYWPWQPRLQIERRRASGRQTELLERFFLTKPQVLHLLVGSGA